MSNGDRRKELQAQYRQTRPEAGVYRLVNRENGKWFLSSARDLASVRNKLAFAQTTHTSGGFDYRLHPDFRAFGADAFALEILDVIEPTPETTDAELRRDLDTLEALWREKFDLALQY